MKTLALCKNCNCYPTRFDLVVWIKLSHSRTNPLQYKPKFNASKEQNKAGKLVWFLIRKNTNDPEQNEQNSHLFSYQWLNVYMLSLFRRYSRLMKTEGIG